MTGAKRGGVKDGKQRAVGKREKEAGSSERHCQGGIEAAVVTFVVPCTNVHPVETTLAIARRGGGRAFPGRG